MSNDTHGTTGARLTEANARFLVARAADYQHYMDDLPENAALRAMRMLATDVLAFAADRTALVAEVTRLEFDAGVYLDAAAVYLDDLHAAEAQVAAMRPLVEAVANDDASVYVNGKTYCGTCHVETWPDEKPHVPGCKVAQAIVMVATWQKGGVDSEA